ncbi:MAG: hypothetical protein ACK443_00020 [Methylococcaceae bacterium]
MTAQEMVFDAHERAFAFFGGVPVRMVYDNLKTVVETIFAGNVKRTDGGVTGFLKPQPNRDVDSLAYDIFRFVSGPLPLQ